MTNYSNRINISPGGEWLWLTIEATGYDYPEGMAGDLDFPQVHVIFDFYNFQFKFTVWPAKAQEIAMALRMAAVAHKGK